VIDNSTDFEHKVVRMIDVSIAVPFAWLAFFCLCSLLPFYVSTGFPCLPENAVIVLVKFPGPGKPWKSKYKVLKSPENLSPRTWKVLQNLSPRSWKVLEFAGQ